MLKKTGPAPVAIGKFGAWLLANVTLHNMTYEETARRAHLSNSNVVCKHIRHKMKPSFQTVATYCWVFDYNNPEFIWKLVEEDWA